MITEKEYFEFIIKQQKKFTDEIKTAIEAQTKLSEIAHKNKKFVTIF